MIFLHQKGKGLNIAVLNPFYDIKIIHEDPLRLVVRVIYIK